MTPNPSLLGYPWIALGAVWLAAAAGKKAAIQRQPLQGRLLQIGLGFLGFFLLTRPSFGWGWLGQRFVPGTAAVFATGFALEIAGITFALWARFALGGNWSGHPSLMAGHELITSGPYAVARHPIYSGLLLGAVGTSVAIGEWRCLAGVCVLFLTFLVKIRYEERLMMQAFPGHYATYRRRVKALIPGVF
jgi:protein-S-isoprenylcysteine O-methyltransferase Ste14